MKIKDLPRDKNLGGIKVIVPDGHPEYEFKTGYWVSQWGYPDGKAGVWLKKDLSDRRIYPVFLDKLEEILEWEIENKE